MLQSQSKYHHPNSLSHFLALHNSAAIHHAQQQQQQHHHQQSYHQSSHFNGQHHLEDNTGVNTSLDVGKSFTIAAILGLQKTALENNKKDFSSAMNLSLNSNQQHQNSDGGNSVNNLNCDNMADAANRYLPQGGMSANNHGGHMRLNHFGQHAAAAAAVTAAVAASAPSALQSLQQLHQHHAQQTNMAFQRDKMKSEPHSGKKSSLKSKRVRTIFTPEQLERLEAEFERQQYMVGPERLYLAHTLQLTEAQVKVWFQNRRIKWRKHHLEITQQRLALLRQTQLSANGEDAINNDNGENEMRQMTVTGGSQNPSESDVDLSVCNDSMDGESGAECDVS